MNRMPDLYLLLLEPCSVRILIRPFWATASASSGNNLTICAPPSTHLVKLPNLASDGGWSKGLSSDLSLPSFFPLQLFHSLLQCIYVLSHSQVPQVCCRVRFPSRFTGPDPSNKKQHLKQPLSRTAVAFGVRGERNQGKVGRT